MDNNYMIKLGKERVYKEKIVKLFNNIKFKKWFNIEMSCNENIYSTFEPNCFHETQRAVFYEKNNFIYNADVFWD